MQVDPRQALLACAESLDSDIGAGALWLASEDYPDVEPERWLALLDELGVELATRCSGLPGVTTVPVISGLLRERLGLRGAGGGDPQTHYIHRVLERGAGVPLSCSAIWIAVGRRAGLPVEGVGLPGRFVVRVDGALVDPFAGGELLDDGAARRLVASVLGSEPARLDAAWLGAASPRSMLARMSRNLRGVYASREEWALALRAADRCVALLPEEPAELRDRGLLHWRLGEIRDALGDLRVYLERVPRAPDRAHVEEVVSRLRSDLN
jgi:regulator of sirC expression with transglutaminase-like and TPR domain